MATPYPFLVRGAADAGFLAHVASLIEAHPGRFTSNRHDPARRQFWELVDDSDPVLKAKKLALIEEFGITGWRADPNLHDLISRIAPGGQVHPHRDVAQAGRMHVRINVLVGAPEAGCVPVLDGNSLDVAAGDAWVCFASHCEHATTPVIGSRERILLSYGLQVEQLAGFPLFARYRAWMNAAAREQGAVRVAADDAPYLPA
jgi:hypothetical protein